MLREWAKAQLARGLRPHEFALAVAVGWVCAFFPVLGLATPLCVLAGWRLRLNQALIQAVNGLTSPLYPPLVYVFVRLGAGISRTPILSAPRLGLSALAHASPELLAALARTVGQALIGWFVLSAVWLPVCYLAVRAAFRLRRSAAGSSGSGRRSLPAGVDG